MALANKIQKIAVTLAACAAVPAALGQDSGAQTHEDAPAEPAKAESAQAEPAQAEPALPEGMSRDEAMAKGLLGPPKFYGEVEFFAGFTTDSNLDGGGSFRYNGAKVRLKTNAEIAPRWRIDTPFSYTIDQYEFDGPGKLAGLDPWGTVHTLTIRPSLFWSQDQQWTYFGGPIFQYSGEDGAEFSESYVWGGGFGVNYTHAPDQRIALGLVAVGRLEDSALPFPLISYNWRLTDVLTIRSPDSDLGPIGPGAELGLKTGENTEVSVGISYGSDRFRLDDSGVAPGGVGRVTSVPLYTRFDHDFNPRTRLTLFAGLTLWNQVELMDSNGVRIQQEDGDPAAAFGIRFTRKF